MTAAPASPYKGLAPFGESELDAQLFFGRERDREIVVANLIAARLTVLYGPSGVGKSSLLRAGVARALRELPEEPLVVVFSAWRPLLALVGAYLFGGVTIIQLQAQTSGLIDVPSQVMSMLPYIATIVVLVVISAGPWKGRLNPPACLGIPFRPAT